MFDVNKNFYNLLLILLLYIADTINLLILSPMIPFLLLKYKMIDNINNASLYSGYFAGVYYFGQFISSYPFSILYKNYKMKMLLFGLLVSIICNLTFILSTNYYLSLVIRFMYGIFNGNFCLVKIVIAEISTRENAVKNYSYLVTAWSIGGFLAPVLGMAYNDNSNHPTFFPFLLSSIISLIALYLNFHFFEFEQKIEENKTETKEETKIEIKNDNNDIEKEMLYASIACVAAYLLYSAMEIAYGEISYVLFSSQNYGYTNKEIDLILAINNIFGLIAPIFLAKIEEYITRKNVFSLCVAFTDIVLLLIASFTNYTLVCIFSTIRLILSNWTISIIYVFLSNTSSVNKINGISQSLGSFIKIVFPIVSTNLFYFTNINIVFTIIVSISILLLISSNYIKN